MNTPNWFDRFGRGCDVYETFDDPGCSKYGSLYEGYMGGANDNCCHCRGGSHTPTILANPTELCFDTPNWTDDVGHGCDDYQTFDAPGCPNVGMGVANDNCCYCGGGNLSVSQIHDLVWN